MIETPVIVFSQLNKFTERTESKSIHTLDQHTKHLLLVTGRIR